ncbi:cytosolic phospholipase A2 gamma [Oryctolagus cuniculus]|uniref:cytosolic phospholipase A2 gamma n=1 Tax=Oryctolagus cuniculus TaxID=9986 RepID=UPI00223222F6|nr:cytosolic phospholipase A2 gamma isoform X1 [Oryctolagus cuniculus]XP_017195427.2 cytosolic phospholipase A2 gamma isoform X1 [Oryctolagus cuniculus]XP_051693397.1 cytosolic phospholipase A2 gamma isoform X1 [Oryctolagus cuniculus]XP_051693398.1 cytosolic phospholipase A2 gamma isoform X3 [Oryctolagus cuniculus]XP_051693400.1 cytosolic phospholipase A2 gamma isoform X1 [Oryctolagus cuniculus]
MDCDSAEVSIIPGIQKEEKAAVEKRSQQVLAALKKLNIEADEAPVIAVLCSGGGLRAHIACLGVLSELQELGLLDAVTYLAGVSGSTWAMSSFYNNEGNTKDTEDDLKRRFDQKDWDLTQSMYRTIQAAKEDTYSLTDFWAYMVVTKHTRELQESCLSSMKQPVDEGRLPYPLFAAIDVDFQTAWKEKKSQKTWFEFTPHHAGYPALGAYVSTTHFGSRFENGKLIEAKPERDLAFLKGLWGSALASMEAIKECIMEKLQKWKESLHPKCEYREVTLKGMAINKSGHVGLTGQSHGPQRRLQYSMPSHVGLTGSEVDEALLDLLLAYVQDPSSSSVIDRLQALQLQLAREGREVEPEHTWLAEMIQHWSSIPPEEQGQFLEYLVYSFTREEETPVGSERSGPMMQCRMYSPMSTVKNIFQSLTKSYYFMTKTALCCYKWEWGTIHNFLYRHGAIADKTMRSRELLHLVDAGFAINTPYPLVLPPSRKAQLILSFDFSAGDPFETIRATADYCHRHKIAFPAVEEAMLKKWAKAPDSCYVLRGDAGPVVMHFPLFNKDTCGDGIQELVSKYGTIKLANTYTLEKVTQLLELSKKNVRLNTERILQEMQKAASAKEPPARLRSYCMEGVMRYPLVKVAGVMVEDKTEDVVEDVVEDVAEGVTGSRAVSIEITNNTDETFTDPVFYCQSGHAREAPPPVLAPKHTISCSFTKASASFQGSVGLLVYQGRAAHLALLFSVPFSYALHSIEFAVAVLAGPVSTASLEHMFHSIMQGTSPELKVARCALKTPQNTLQLEHDSLTLRAVVSNVRTARMKVVVERKACPAHPLTPQS